MKAALITNAVSHIGSAIATRLAADGWHVVLHHAGLEEAGRALLERVAAIGAQAFLIDGDPAGPDGQDHIVEAAFGCAAGLELLVNAVSFKDRRSTVSPQSMLDVLALEVAAPALLGHLFAARLPADRQGAIIDILDATSLDVPSLDEPSLEVQGRAPGADDLALAIGKAARGDALRVMARTLAPRIRVNGIATGRIAATDAAARRIGDAVVFILATPALTGSIITLDDGSKSAKPADALIGWRAASIAVPAAIAGQRSTPGTELESASPVMTSSATSPAGSQSDRSAAARGERPRRRVFVQDYELIGSVGVYEHERRYEQRIVVSLDLEVEDRYDGQSDDLAGIYDYDHAISAIRQTVESGHFNLLETLAERIAEACLAAPAVTAIKVRIAKPDVLIACRAVGIEITR